MLLITGQFQNKNYSKAEPIAASVIAKEFGIPSVPQGNNVLEHRILPKKIKTNKADGSKIAPRGFSVPASFTVNYNGDTFTLRYADGPGRSDKNGNMTYAPNMVTFAGTTMAFQAKDYDKFVYMFLHRFNASSPFKGVNPQIEYYDPTAVAVAAQLVAQKQAEMNMAIWNTEITSDEKIRMKAAGIMVRGQSLTVAKNIPTATLRAQLAQLFQRFPDDFIAAWNSEVTLLNGLVNDAIDSGIIEHAANTGNGRPGWVWRKGPATGNVATYTSNNDDLTRTLRTWASQPQNYDQVMQYLTQMLDAETAKEVFNMEGAAPLNLGLSAPKSQWEEKTHEAIEAGVIGFDMATKQVRFVNDEGDFTDQKPLIEGATNKDWVSKTIEFFKSKDSVWHKGELNRRLASAAELV